MDRCFIPCDHEYLNFKGGKFSKSRSAAVDVPYFLSKYDPDPLRFYVSGQARPYAGRRCSLPSWTSV